MHTCLYSRSSLLISYTSIHRVQDVQFDRIHRVQEHVQDNVQLTSFLVYLIPYVKYIRSYHDKIVCIQDGIQDRV